METFERFFQWIEGLPWLDYELGGTTILRWLIAIAIAVVAWIVIRFIMALIKRQVKRLPRITADWEEAIIQTIEATRSWFLLVAAVYVGTLALALPQRAQGVVQTVAVLALLIQAGLWGNKFLKFAIARLMERRRESDPALVTAISAMNLVGGLVLWSIILLLALDNMGIDVTALVAGLGVGGIAVALAAQNLLGDLFASLSIVLDKPFAVGDFIIVGEEMGTVEKIGVKTTRVRALTGEQLVFANTDLLQSRVQNFQRLRERRIVFSVGVTYETSQSKLVAIPSVIRSVVEAQENARFDRSHFKEFGDFSLNYETVYYVLVPDYQTYMDTQQAINLALVDRFAAEGIEFAYPTQTLLVKSLDPPG